MIERFTSRFTSSPGTGEEPVPKSPPPVRRFGTFGGVLTPNILTILGVIMYLRLGWVVGNAGIVGAFVIILLANSVTLCTGLSMSSITTNIRIGAGGAYSIITKSLGAEAGGSIGIPLYIAQTLSAALYIIGFSQAWLYVFPTHNERVVALVAWILLLTVTYISAQLAIRVQYLILTIVAVSIASFLLSPAEWVPDPVIIGGFQDAGFWAVFAIFFPAVTGIMAGANMSGDLKTPRRSIPLGTISAILITTVVYLALAYMLFRIGTGEELRTNQLIMVEKARWGPAVLAGIMGATLSSALGSMLGAPRMLQAMAAQKIVPLHQVLSAKSRSNEPRNAVFFSGMVILVALLTGSLDFLAALITMFFLITYGTLNLVVFIQQSMKLISFRPTFKIPRVVPFLGALGCIFIMFLINTTFSVIALATIFVLYIWLTRRGLASGEGDIRGGLFLALAARASVVAENFPRHQVSWKPDLLVPVEDPEIWAGPLSFIRNITFPSGSIFAFTITPSGDSETSEAFMGDLLQPIKDQNIRVHSAVIEDDSFFHGARTVIQTLRGGAFRPNTLFLTVGDHDRSLSVKPGEDNAVSQLVALTLKHNMGVAILRQHPRIAFGMQQDVNLWLRDKSPNWHLAILLSLQLQLNWEGKINLITVSDNGEEEEKSLYEFLDRLSDQARLSSMTEIFVLRGPFRDALAQAPRADVNIFGLSMENELPIEFIKEVPEAVRSSCVFVVDSGFESALA